MAASTAGINPLGRLVRKSLFGSRFDCIVAASCQLGAKRMAIDPAQISSRNPMRIIMVMISQSRRSCLVACIGAAVEWQSYKDRCARKCRFVEARTFKPDATAVCDDNPTCDRQSQTGSAAAEFGLARRV